VLLESLLEMNQSNSHLCSSDTSSISSTSIEEQIVDGRQPPRSLPILFGSDPVDGLTSLIFRIRLERKSGQDKSANPDLSFRRLDESHDVDVILAELSLS